MPEVTISVGILVLLHPVLSSLSFSVTWQSSDTCSVSTLQTEGAIASVQTYKTHILLLLRPPLPYL